VNLAESVATDATFQVVTKGKIGPAHIVVIRDSERRVACYVMVEDDKSVGISCVPDPMAAASTIPQPAP